MIRKLPQLLAVGLLVLTSGAIASDSKLIGNTDGKAFVSECPPGKAVVGWKYNSDDRLRAIVALCNMVDPATGAAGGAIRPASDTLIGGDFGAGAEGGSGERKCKHPTHVVHSLSVNLTDTLAVHSMRATCPAPGRAPAYMSRTNLAANAPPAAAKGLAECPSRSYATALIGTFRNSGPRQGISSIGLRCQAIGETPAAADTGDDGANDQADMGDDEGGGDDGFQLEVDIGPDGIQIGGGNKGGGKARFTDEPTTVYAKPAGKEIAYLEQGDRVTIVACEDGGQGWCQISRPVKGFVWGGDLD